VPKTVVITGASDGIGAAAARRLHAEGHRVVVVGRSPEKTAAVAEEIGTLGLVADFAVLDEVRRLAAEIDAACPTIDVLANNAGGSFPEQVQTVDGHDRTFQVNHLAPFLLTRLLTEKLVASRASVIQTASVGARAFGRIEMDDLEHRRDWSPLRAYGTTKLENILFTVELDRRHRADGLAAAAFHPGVVASNFAAEMGGVSALLYRNPLSRFLLTSSEKGADQLAWLATGAPGTDWEAGAYYEKRRPARRMSPQARDPELARWLWERSEAMLAGG
jgi:NAD(P)-dependent dehydrogenase (short-subunit alcohol dehydrogenase family)